MAKRHRTRPALRAVDVFRWVINGVLEVRPVKRTPIMYTSAGKVVRQRWFRRRRGQVETATAVTYLRMGTFLVPRWIRVPAWRAAYLEERGLATRAHGFATFEGELKELCYMQVEDLDHSIRQQDYVLEGYELPENPQLGDFMALMDRLIRVEAIRGKVAIRKAGVENLHTLTTVRLRSLSRSLRSIVENAPIFRGDSNQRDRGTVTNALEKASRECLEVRMRPFGTRVRRAGRSLGLAATHIQTGRIRLARARIRSALKNLELPPVAT